MTDTFLHDWAEREQEKDRTFFLRNCRPRYEKYTEGGITRFRVVRYDLETNEYRQKRKAAFARAGKKCERCHIRRPVNIHHTSYRNVGREFSTDLLAVCRECHEYIHFGTNHPGQLDLFVTQNKDN